MYMHKEITFKRFLKQKSVLGQAGRGQSDGGTSWETMASVQAGVGAVGMERKDWAETCPMGQMAGPDGLVLGLVREREASGKTPRSLIG